MADPHWTSYAGMLTGIAGLGLAFISLRKTSSLKSLDLRVEARTAKNEISNALEELNKIGRKAKESRPGVASALGFLRSGRMQAWQQETDEREDKAKQFQNENDKISSNFDSMSTKQLENTLVQLRQIKSNVDALTNEYKSDLAWDEEQRKIIQKNATERFRNKQ